MEFRVAIQFHTTVHIAIFPKSLVCNAHKTKMKQPSKYEVCVLKIEFHRKLQTHLRPTSINILMFDWIYVQEYYY